MPPASPERAAILAERAATLIRLDTFKTELGRLNQECGGRIHALQNEADHLALLFRKRLNDSQEAYRQGDKKLAKKFSSEGRALERRCKKLNAEANTLRQRFKNLHQAIASTEADIARLNDALRKLSAPTTT